jgi:hypothetical protein
MRARDDAKRIYHHVYIDFKLVNKPFIASFRIAEIEFSKRFNSQMSAAKYVAGFMGCSIRSLEIEKTNKAGKTKPLKKYAKGWKKRKLIVTQIKPQAGTTWVSANSVIKSGAGEQNQDGYNIMDIRGVA